MEQQTSLNKKLSKKVSLWILIFFSFTTAVILFAIYLASKNMFNEQVSTWNSIFPKHSLSFLIDSDNFSIQKEVGILKLTKLFSSFSVLDSQKRAIAHFGPVATGKTQYISIKDSAGVVWGYYSYKTDFYVFFLPFLKLAGIYILIAIFCYFFMKWRLFSDLNVEFSSFNKFLLEIEMLSKKIGGSEALNKYDLLKKTQTKNIEERRVAAAVYTLVDEINRSHKQLKENIKATEKQRSQARLTEVALQVAHDIRSPLSTLDIIVSQIKTLKDNERTMFKEAVTRIRDISNDLLSKHNRRSKDHAGMRSHLISQLIERVVSEKRLLNKGMGGIEIDFSVSNGAFTAFSEVNASDLKRICSNLINNSIDAIAGPGRVEVSLFCENNNIVLEVADNGKGIPSDVISKLGGYGESFQKVGGSGLGLYHAKDKLVSWGGSLAIKSEVDKGTKVVVELKKTEPPRWFLSHLIINPKYPVIILDDQDYAHTAWSTHLKKYSQTLAVYHLYTQDELQAWLEKNKDLIRQSLFLCDYQLGDSGSNGVEIIEKWLNAGSSYVITDLADDEDLVSKCKEKNIGLMPKKLIPYVEIVFVS